MNALKYHWYEIILLSQAGCFEAYGVQRFYLQEVCAKDQCCSYPAKNEEIYDIIPYQFFVSCYNIRKLQHMGHKWVVWVTSGLFCGSVGQMGQQVQPTLYPDPPNPDLLFCNLCYTKFECRLTLAVIYGYIAVVVSHL